MLIYFYLIEQIYILFISLTPPKKQVKKMNNVKAYIHILLALMQNEWVSNSSKLAMNAV